MTPITRKEHYLAKIAGDDVPIPSTPLTREEAYLARIAENGGGGGSGVTDVQVNGTSVVTDGVANVPVANTSTPGVVTVGGYGLTIVSGKIRIVAASQASIKSGEDTNTPIIPSSQHSAAFYGFAKAAGDSTQASSSNAVGNYTESAKSAISEMLNAPETVSGSTPSITAKAGIRYACGEVSTLALTLPASGDVEVIFESGSTATVLTLTPPTGITAVKWPSWFDPDNLDANTVYDIIITDGKYGVVALWA